MASDPQAINSTPSLFERIRSRASDALGRWPHVCAFTDGMRLSWPSLLSVAIGLYLYLTAPQVRDLFLDTRGGVAFWVGFYVAAVLLWALPVFVSSRWILRRIEIEPDRFPSLPRIPPWVRAQVPIALGALCFVAVLLGQLAALNYVPEVRGSERLGSIERDLNETRHECWLPVGAAQRAAERLGGVRETLCIVGKLSLRDRLPALVYGVERELVALQLKRDTPYLVLALTIGWLVLFWATRGLVAGGVGVARYLLASASLMLLLNMSVFFVVFSLDGIAPRSTALGALANTIRDGLRSPGTQYVSVFLSLAAFGASTAAAIRWRVWRILLAATNVLFAIVVICLSGVYFAGLARLEQTAEFGHAHLVLQPIATVAVAWLLWRALAPGPSSSLSWAGRALLRLVGRGERGSVKAAMEFLINPLFFALLALTFGVLLAVLVVPGEILIEKAHLQRAILLPITLGIPIASITWLSYHSRRKRAPLTAATVFSIAIVGIIATDPYRINPIPSASTRPDLEQAFRRWMKANGCEGKVEQCPSPVIIAAAGGASRSAFFVSSIIGMLIDDDWLAVKRLHVRHTLTGSVRSVMSALFSLDDKVVFAASWDNSLKSWRVTDGSSVSEGKHGEETGEGANTKRDADVNEVRIAPAGGDPARWLLLTVADDGIARLWQRSNSETINLAEATGKEVVARGTTETAARLLGGAFHPKEPYFAVAMQDGMVQLWTLDAGKLGKGGLAKAWSAPDGQRPAKDANSVDFSPDGRFMAVASDDELVHLWDVSDIRAPRYLQPLKGHRGMVYSVRFSPKGLRLVSASADHTARLWEFDPARGTWGGPADSSGVIKGHHDAVRGAAFNSDGTLVVTASWDKTGSVWRTSDLKRLAVLLGHRSNVNSAAFSSDGRFIVTASDDQSVRIWDVPDLIGTTVPLAPAFPQRLFAISAVSGGSLAAAVTYAALYDVQMGQAPPAAKAHDPPCVDRDPAAAEDWFKYRTSGSATARLAWGWQDCLQMLTAGDFLSPVFLTWFGRDLVRLPLHLFSAASENRAEALERAVVRRYRRLTPPGDGGSRRPSTLERPLSELRAEASSRNVWLPILVFNGTSVLSGRRIVASDVDLRYSDAKNITGPALRDTLDLHALIAPRPAGVVSKANATSSGQSPPPAVPSRPHFDIGLASAVMVSARFPGISPPGSIYGSDMRRLDMVVDGGFFENFGATSAQEVARALKAIALKIAVEQGRKRRGGKPPITPIVVQITSHQRTPQVECEHKVEVKPATEPASFLEWFPTFSSPVTALFASQHARGMHGAIALCQEGLGHASGTFFTVAVEPDPTELPMSWWLSKRVQGHLNAQISDYARNYDMLARLRDALNPRRSRGPKVPMMATADDDAAPEAR